jgi:NAD-dependent dihydropyrimidine dehydrogenase PreA subunit
MTATAWSSISNAASAATPARWPASEHFLPQRFWAVWSWGDGQIPYGHQAMCPVIRNHAAICVRYVPPALHRRGRTCHLDYDQCVGCRYCLITCPYQQRTFLVMRRVLSRSGPHPV